jgi:hypothetical protein
MLAFRKIPAIGDHHPGTGSDPDIVKRSLADPAEGGDAVRAVPVGEAGQDLLAHLIPLGSQGHRLPGQSEAFGLE